jgi:hypothetical protein
MRATPRTPFLAVLLLSFAAACTPAATGGVQYLAPPTYRPGVVELVNDAQEDLILYLVRDGVRYRLGRVSRMETAEFRLPEPEARPSYRVSLVAEPVGPGRSPIVTAPLLWRPGQSLRARVGRNPAASTFDIVLR